MYKNKAPDGRNNICGKRIKKFREQLPEKTSQKQFSDMLQIAGLDVDKNAVQRIENHRQGIGRILSGITGLTQESGCHFWRLTLVFYGREYRKKRMAAWAGVPRGHSLLFPAISGYNHCPPADRGSSQSGLQNPQHPYTRAPPRTYQTRLQACGRC